MSSIHNRLRRTDHVRHIGRQLKRYNWWNIWKIYTDFIFVRRVSFPFCKQVADLFNASDIQYHHCKKGAFSSNLASKFLAGFFPLCVTSLTTNNLNFSGIDRKYSAIHSSNQGRRKRGAGRGHPPGWESEGKSPRTSTFSMHKQCTHKPTKAEKSDLPPGSIHQYLLKTSLDTI